MSPGKEFIHKANATHKHDLFIKSKKIFQRGINRFAKHTRFNKSYSRRLFRLGAYKSLVNFVLKKNLNIKKNNKKSVVIFGNCQATPLEDILCLNENFTRSFGVIKYLPSIHEMPNELQSILLDHLSEFDIVISQSILNKDWELSTDALRKRAKQIVIYPTCFFKGYHPDLTYLKKKGQTIRSTPVVDYHSAIVLYSFIKVKSIDECVKTLISGEWIGTSYWEWIDDQFQELYKREKEYDVKAVDFIYENYKKYILFYTFNHPAPLLMLHIAEGIFNLLNINGSFYNDIKQKTSHFFKSIQWLISDAIIEKLGLNKRGREPSFLLNNKPYSPFEFVDLHYRYYEKHPDIIEENKTIITDTIERLA